VTTPTHMAQARSFALLRSSHLALHRPCYSPCKQLAKLYPVCGMAAAAEPATSHVFSLAHDDQWSKSSMTSEQWLRSAPRGAPAPWARTLQTSDHMHMYVTIEPSVWFTQTSLSV
jgi:hypothetical protein